MVSISRKRRIRIKDEQPDDLYRLRNLFESIDDSLDHPDSMVGLMRAATAFGQAKEIISHLSWLDSDMLKEKQEQLIEYNIKIEQRAKMFRIIEL